MLLATGLASVLATLALWVVISVQSGFPIAASLVGSSSVLVGGLLTILAGGALGVIYAVLLEYILSEPIRIDPVSTTTLGFVIGVGMWLLVVPMPLAVVTGSDVPLLHLGTLVALAGYGVVFGSVYGLVRGAFSPRSPARLTPNSLHPSQNSK